MAEILTSPPLVFWDMREREQLTPLSDITASSKFGVDGARLAKSENI